jgi:hypothetical protein
MSEPVDPIPKDLADAFADAVLAYDNWHPQFEGRQIPIAGQFYRIEQVSDLVSKFTDPLPDHVFRRLRSYMHHMPGGELIAELEACPTYRVGGTCLRRMIERQR